MERRKPGQECKIEARSGTETKMCIIKDPDIYPQESTHLDL